MLSLHTVRGKDKKEEYSKYIWWNYSLKHPKLKENNIYSGIRNNRGSQKDKPKQTYTNTYDN